MRTRWTSRLTAAATVLPLLAAPWFALPDPAEANHAADHVAVSVEVSYRGYDGEPEWEIEVQQGQLVEITFVWADHAVPDNAHRQLVRGYDVRSALIDADNPKDTISFIADRPGVFEIVCDWRCEGHRTLERGRLRVIGVGGADNGLESEAVSVAPAQMALSDAGGGPGPLPIAVQLNAAEGGFIADAPVRFFLPGSFAGVEGDMEIGRVRTDEHGTATFQYRPTRAGEQQVIARFEGRGLHGPAEAAIDVTVTAAQPAFEIEAKGLQPLRSGAPYVFALIALALWSTFAYALFQAVRIRDDRE